jgi:hypothetical protein
MYNGGVHASIHSGTDCHGLFRNRGSVMAVFGAARGAGFAPSLAFGRVPLGHTCTDDGFQLPCILYPTSAPRVRRAGQA